MSRGQKKGKYNNVGNTGSTGVRSTGLTTMYFRKPIPTRVLNRKLIKGECVVLKAADPEKVKAWHETEEYKQYMKNKALRQKSQHYHWNGNRDNTKKSV
jgi:hypothetical protein